MSNFYEGGSPKNLWQPFFSETRSFVNFMTEEGGDLKITNFCGRNKWMTPNLLQIKSKLRS